MRLSADCSREGCRYIGDPSQFSLTSGFVCCNDILCSVVLITYPFILGKPN